MTTPLGSGTLDHFGHRKLDTEDKPPANPVLLACPFCGGDPDFVWSNGSWHYCTSGFKVRCKSCGTCSVREGLKGLSSCEDQDKLIRDAKLKLAETWNRRTTQSKPTLPKRDLIRFFREGKPPTWGGKSNELVDNWIADKLHLILDIPYSDLQVSKGNKVLVEARNTHKIRLFEDMGHYFLVFGEGTTCHYSPQL